MTNIMRGVSVVAGQACGIAHWFNSVNIPSGSILLVRGLISPHVAVSASESLAVLSTGGGASSHGAIFLRQKRIPCVCSILGLENVVEGEQIEVNATTGVVRRL